MAQQNELNRRYQDELKPCPFCGGMAEIVIIRYHIHDDSLIVVRCSRCISGTRIFNEQKVDAAISAWNTRITQ